MNFLVIGDGGEPNEDLKMVAAAMNRIAERLNPQFIIALGDNIYENGVSSPDDPRFLTQWANVFLDPYPALRIPWRMTLGNHDYYDNPMAQVEFTTHPNNPSGLWQCPGKCYQFSINADEELIEGAMAARVHRPLVDYFCIDTNGSQEDVRHCQNYRVRPRQFKYPTIAEDLRGFVADLSDRLRTSTARWKIVYGHHPIYTKGRLHHEESETLKRDYGFEEVLRSGGADVYLAGHEHVFQHHVAHGVHHLVGGSSCRFGFYGGEDRGRSIDWFDATNSPGFIAATATEESLVFKFINSADDSIIKEVKISK